MFLTCDTSNTWGT